MQAMLIKAVESWIARGQAVKILSLGTSFVIFKTNENEIYALRTVEDSVRNDVLDKHGVPSGNRNFWSIKDFTRLFGVT